MKHDTIMINGLELRIAQNHPVRHAVTTAFNQDPLEAEHFRIARLFLLLAGTGVSFIGAVILTLDKIPNGLYAGLLLFIALVTGCAAWLTSGTRSHATAAFVRDFENLANYLDISLNELAPATTNQLKIKAEERARTLKITYLNLQHDVSQSGYKRTGEIRRQYNDMVRLCKRLGILPARYEEL